jgi:hypothetical protein
MRRGLLDAYALLKASWQKVTFGEAGGSSSRAVDTTEILEHTVDVEESDLPSQD